MIMPCHPHSIERECWTWRFVGYFERRQVPPPTVLGQLWCSHSRMGVWKAYLWLSSYQRHVLTNTHWGRPLRDVQPPTGVSQAARGARLEQAC